MKKAVAGGVEITSWCRNWCEQMQEASCCRNQNEQGCRRGIYARGVEIGVNEVVGKVIPAGGVKIGVNGVQQRSILFLASKSDECEAVPPVHSHSSVLSSTHIKNKLTKFVAQSPHGRHCVVMVV